MMMTIGAKGRLSLLILLVMPPTNSCCQRNNQKGMAEDTKGIYKYPGKDFAEEDISKLQNNDTATITAHHFGHQVSPDQHTEAPPYICT